MKYDYLKSERRLPRKKRKRLNGKLQPTYVSDLVFSDKSLMAVRINKNEVSILLKEIPDLPDCDTAERILRECGGDLTKAVRFCAMTNDPAYSSYRPFVIP